MLNRINYFTARSLSFFFVLCAVNCFPQDDPGIPVAGKSWILRLPDNTNLPLIWIPPGSFDMGSRETASIRKADESPQHEVILTKGYWLAKTEVTIGQWKAVMGETLRDHVMHMLTDENIYDFAGNKQKLREYMHFDPNDPDKIMANEDETLPMYFVSWYDAMEFCEKLTSVERSMTRLPDGYVYTLPTEAQWEYASRTGVTISKYSGSLNNNSPLLDSICWYSGNSALGYSGKKLANTSAGPRTVGEKLPNGRGLMDLYGNLWEWCRDWYGPYMKGNSIDPSGPRTGRGKVNRGGSWGSGANDQRSEVRAQNPPAEKSAYRGFRVALCALE